jgi:hypothetical protein
MQEDFSSRNFGTDGNPNADWILEGLNIEDEQCVFSSPLSSTNHKDIGFAFGSWCGRQGGIRRLKRARRSQGNGRGYLSGLMTSTSLPTGFSVVAPMLQSLDTMIFSTMTDM